MNFCCHLNLFSSSPQEIESIPLINFVAINLIQYKNHLKSSYERIREIDSLRLHLPTMTERINLRVPIIFEHIDMLNIISFLTLCGGNNGVHFTIHVNYLINYFYLFFSLLFLLS